MAQIAVTGFRVHFTGDRSVGIWDADWRITGEFYFESPAELEEFRKTLKEAWELVSDTPLSVITEEEYKKDEEQMDRLDEEMAAAEGVKIITRRMQEEYLKAPNTCMFCGSEHIEGDSIDVDLDLDHEEAGQVIRCLNCGEKWADVYKLHHVIYIGK